MLKRLRLKAKKSDVYDSVNVVVADGERLPFRENVFDCLVCALAFDHFEDCEGGGWGVFEGFERRWFVYCERV